MCQVGWELPYQPLRGHCSPGVPSTHPEHIEIKDLSPGVSQGLLGRVGGAVREGPHWGEDCTSALPPCPACSPKQATSAPQVPWLHAVYAVLGAGVFTLVSVAPWGPAFSASDQVPRPLHHPSLPCSPLP